MQFFNIIGDVESRSQNLWHVMTHMKEYRFQNYKAAQCPQNFKPVALTHSREQETLFIFVYF